jgi:iron complex transport system substrate-binding protein
MASHTLWRWPPDSSSTTRSASPVTPVAATAASSSVDHDHYLGNPAMFADLMYLCNQGLDLLTPNFDPNEPHWEVLSWEQDA